MKMWWERETKMNITEELFNKKFKSDEIYQEISKKYVSLDSGSIKYSNKVLYDVIVDRLIPCMEYVDDDFEETFKFVMNGESFYKQLKVGNPDKYDLNIVLKLHVNHEYLEADMLQNYPGYVKIRDYSNNNNLYGNKHFLYNITHGSYLDQNKFRKWLHNVLVRALGRYGQLYGRKDFSISYGKHNSFLEIKVICLYNNQEIFFNLLPCLRLPDKVLHGIQKSFTNEWVVIAKPLPQETYQANVLWRTSFYEDERILLQGHIKPVIRMVKAFRDVQEWTEIKDYFIETLFMHELTNHKFKFDYEEASRTCIFVYIMKRLQEVLEYQWLSYYWIKNQNLLDKINSNSLQSMAKDIQNIIDTVDNQIDYDPEILLSYFQEDDSDEFDDEDDDEFDDEDDDEFDEDDDEFDDEDDSEYDEDDDEDDSEYDEDDEDDSEYDEDDDEDDSEFDEDDNESYVFTDGKEDSDEEESSYQEEDSYEDEHSSEEDSDEEESSYQEEDSYEDEHGSEEDSDEESGSDID